MLQRTDSRGEYVLDRVRVGIDNAMRRLRIPQADFSSIRLDGYFPLSTSFVRLVQTASGNRWRLQRFLRWISDRLLREINNVSKALKSAGLIRW